MGNAKGNFEKIKEDFVETLNESLCMFDSKGFVRKVTPYVKQLEKEHAEMHEALKWAYKVLSRVDHSYTERNTPEGQMKLSGMRFILKSIES